MSVHLIRDIEDVHRDILRMCAMTEDLVGRAVDGLTGAAPGLAERLKADDRRIDWYDVQVEEKCLKIFALHQPVAIDLRRVVSVLKITKELERVADLGVHIAERVLETTGVEPPELRRLRHMARIALDMLRAAIDAYVDLDAAKARQVCMDDDLVDGLNREVIRGLTERMKADPAAVDSSLSLFSVSRHLERIADHATNIAQDAIYMVEGEIVRHRKKFPDRTPGESAEERFESTMAAPAGR